MAKRTKKQTVNKSEKVREYLTSNGTAGPTEVADALKAKGIKVTAQMVSTIKGKMGLSKKRRKRRKKAAVAATSNGIVVMNFSSAAKILRGAKAFVAQAGGVKEAREALDALVTLEK